MQKIKAKILYLPNYDKSWGPMVYAHDNDTGLDVRACPTHNVILAPGERACVPAGFKLLPEYGYGYQIRARSGNALKLGLSLVNGVGTVDYGYLGEVGVILINLSTDTVVIERGMKIAQCVVEPVFQFDLSEIESEEYFISTNRGEGGFGSTG